MKKTIYFPIEIKARELEGKVLLALECAIKGFRGIIGHMGLVNNAIEEGILKKGIYFDKSITKGKENKIKRLKGEKFIVVSQDEECGSLEIEEPLSAFIKHRSSKESIELVDAIFCWGEYDYRAWRHEYTSAKNKLFMTGSHRVDYWRGDFSSYFENESKKLKKKYDSFVLISSNFGLTSNSNGYMDVRSFFNQARKQGRIKREEDEKFLMDMIDGDERMFREFVNLVNTLAPLIPNVNIVVRPHPGEKIKGWKDKLKGNSNVHVCFEGGISKWVRSCIAVIHNGCSTAAEAYTCGVPVISYAPFETRLNTDGANSLGEICTNHMDVFYCIRKVLENSYMHKRTEAKKFVQKRFMNSGGSTAVENIVRQMKQLSVPEIPYPKINKELQIKGYRRMIQRKLYKNFVIENKIMRKFPGLKLKEIEEIKDNLCHVNPLYESCKIKKLYDEIYVIE